MPNDILWNTETEVAEYLTVPAFIEQDITCNDIAAILQGGCESGAYMPAVEYATALETMRRHGDAVYSLLEDWTDGPAELVAMHDPQSWEGMAVVFVVVAVEAWAYSIEDELTEALENEALEDENEDD